MITAFSSIYEAFKGFFDRAFWFGTFLPVSIFATIHAAMASLVLEKPVSLLGITLDLPKSVSGDATAWTGLLVVLIVVSYALVPFVPLFAGLLDGSLLPPGLHDWLRSSRIPEARRALALMGEALAQIGPLQRMVEDLDDESGIFNRAYAESQNLNTSADEVAVKAAEDALVSLEVALLNQKSRLANAATDARRAVIVALQKNKPDSAQPSGSQATIAQRTNTVAEGLGSLLMRARGEAVFRYRILKTRYRTADALEAPRATLFGDARLSVELYSQKIYNVDFDFLWPRLLAAVQAETTADPLRDKIDSARATINFSILSLFLSASIPALWLPVLIVRGGSPWLFFVIGVLAPVVLSFFYRILFEAQLAFGTVVKATIDRSRFLVLGMLRQPEPLSRSEERALWARIEAAAQDNRLTDLVYLPRDGNVSK